MDDPQFETQADAAFERLERALEATDLDFELKEGGVIEIEFDDGSKIIVNRHGAAREIWVAARSGGFHYRWDGRAWRDSRGDQELFSSLSELISDQLGRRVRLVG